MNPTTTCPRCGASVMPGARFCPSCGNDISGEQMWVTTAEMPSDTSITATAEAEMLAALQDATLGEYDVVGELGRGGMAIVYLAHDIALDRKVAIKVMLPSMLMGEGMVERFRREARTAASLSHPHLIPIHVVKQSDKLLYFVMKFVAGRTLDSVIKEAGPLPIKMVQSILSQVGGALGYAHRRGVVHRDIKPGNIMIDEEGWAVVTDFGIAKLSQAEGLTASGAVVGTPAYMSPEQCSGGKEITGASDQYSLGIVAYEMLAGKTPFSGESIMEMMKQHFFDDPPPLADARSDCPPKLCDAVIRMLAKEPPERWPSIEDAVTAIGTVSLDANDPIRTQMIELAKTGAREQLQHATTPRSPIPVSIAAHEKATTRRRAQWLWAATTVVAVGGAGAGWYFLSNRASPEVVQPPDTSQQAAVGVTASDTSGSQLPIGTADTAEVTAATTTPATTPATPEDTDPGPQAPPPVTVDTAVVLLGARPLDGVLYIDDQPIGPIIDRLQPWTVPTGTVRLSIRRQGCVSWDTTITVSPGERLRLGFKGLSCDSRDSLQW